MLFVFIACIVLGSTGKIAPYVNPLIDIYGKHIRIFLLAIAFSSPALLFVPGLLSISDTGEIAFELLWVILFIPILAKVFNQPLAKKFIPWRKELGILMGML